jgi:hypothetical protein
LNATASIREGSMKSGKARSFPPPVVRPWNASNGTIRTCGTASISVRTGASRAALIPSCSSRCSTISLLPQHVSLRGVLLRNFMRTFLELLLDSEGCESVCSFYVLSSGSPAPHLTLERPENAPRAPMTDGNVLVALNVLVLRFSPRSALAPTPHRLHVEQAEGQDRWQRF